MTSAIRLLVGLVLMGSMSLRVQADIVVSTAPVTPGNIVEGTNVVFDIFARSTTGNQAFGFFAFDLIVSTPPSTPLADARGGRLTNPATNLLGGLGWTFGQNPARALFDGQSNGSIPSFTDTNVRIGTITLATAGASPGNYLMDFRNVVTLTSTFQNIASSGSSFSYTISAVPEPSSIALLCVVAGMAGCVYRRRAGKTVL